MKASLKYLGSFLLALSITGCATHGNKMEKTKELVRTGDYDTEVIEVNKVLDQDRNQLLKEIELGAINQLKGDYRKSLIHLELADQLAEKLYTKSFTDLLTRSSSNATFTTYRSNILERVYINYYKMLNYFYLAEETQETSEIQTLLDSARVEARKAMILLDENVHKTGDYADLEDEKDSMLYKLQQAFAALNGEVINPKELIFRDNAFSHYIIGSLFERMGELDSARVSYERSANLYEKGYAEQYKLDAETKNLAWYATARVLQKLKDTRWKQIAKTKLTAEQNAKLAANNAQTGDLLIIQEVDLVAPRGELNLWMAIVGNQAIIKPVLTGTPREQAYQLAWFYYLYADKGLLTIVDRIQSERYLDLLSDPVEKRISVPGFLLDTLKSVGLLDVMATTGIRLAVPLLYYEEIPIGTSTLSINNEQQGKLIKSDNISGLFMAHHLVNAQSELTEAMAVEATRLAVCLQTGMHPMICNLAAISSVSADTRSWLMLPYEIRSFRTQLPEGEHQIKVTSSSKNGFTIEENQSVKVKAGELNVVRIRTFNIETGKRLAPKFKKAEANLKQAPQTTQQAAN